MCFNVAYILLVSLLFFYTVCLVIFHPGLFPGEALDSELVRGDPNQTTKPNHQTTTMEEPWETVLLRFREYIRDAMVASRRFVLKLLRASQIEVIASRGFVFELLRASNSCRDAMVASRRSSETVLLGFGDASVTQ